MSPVLEMVNSSQELASLSMHSHESIQGDRAPGMWVADVAQVATNAISGNVGAVGGAVIATVGVIG
ncbi:hypothetical protein ACFW4O_33255 [Streptomyces mutabilis]|uniref:hypothetical protein n=1 Tax=Streptomyces TaxID=1883 RepID=UPI000BD0FCD4|nr:MULTISPECIES: hypothetical protein [unclassified Streptomyces]MDN3250951.1 hypothetical protein [Streptomyces sp. ZSW22]MDN3257809.1 hypothetical protein [Streptomyces sp. MA25(2023)]PAK24052.1 hypothetical protein CJD44_24945 [Streptomyces sp. alain-838]